MFNLEASGHRVFAPTLKDEYSYSLSDHIEQRRYNYMNIIDWNKVDFKQIREGVFYKTIAGNNMQMFHLKLAPGQVTNHTHAEEQMGYIIAGEAKITIGSETKTCKAGSAYFIPSNRPHGFKVIGDNFLEYLEIFSPPKKEHPKF